MSNYRVWTTQKKEVRAGVSVQHGTTGILLGVSAIDGTCANTFFSPLHGKQIAKELVERAELIEQYQREHND